MTTFTITQDAPWLAPLAGYSDLPFRLLSLEQGAGVVCSEMVSIKGLAYDNGGTKRLLATVPQDTPLVLQIFGADPDLFPDVMDTLITMGFRNFDLNAGCSVRKVMKSGSGVALMRTPDLLVRLAGIMVEKAATHPLGGRVGIKFRLGADHGEDIYLDLGKRLEQEGVDWVSLHPRYGKQLFRGEADWGKLAQLKEHLSIPVVASGDLFTAEDGIRCLEQTGADAIMFARGAMFDPTVFARFRALRQGTALPPMNGQTLAALVRRHIELTRLHEGDERSFRKIRSIIPRYAKGLAGIRALRGSLLQCTNWEELLHAADAIESMKGTEDHNAPQPDTIL